MQMFPCPWCGPRIDAEFRYAGDAGNPRPPRSASDKEWADYLYFRRNTKGMAPELWIHASGCGRWFELRRDTSTHEIAGSGPMLP